FRSNADFVEAPLDDLPQCIEYYLRSDQGQKEAQAIVDQGFQTLTEGVESVMSCVRLSTSSSTLQRQNRSSASPRIGAPSTRSAHRTNPRTSPSRCSALRLPHVHRSNAQTL